MSKKICYGTSHVPLSPAVRAGDYVHISGQVPVIDGKIVGSTVTEQTEAALKNLKAALELAGCSLDDVVKTLVILTDPRYFDEFNKAYAKFFPSNPPARSAIGAQLMLPDLKVEIEAVVYKPL